MKTFFLFTWAYVPMYCIPQVAHLERSGHYLTVKDNQVSLLSLSYCVFTFVCVSFFVCTYIYVLYIGGSASSQHLSGPQARVGPVQRICADHKELHQNLH